MSALIVNKTKKKEDIILAALKVFAEKGLSNSTIKEIADRAGIGKGTIYEYFKDKNEIIHSSFFYFQKFFEVDMENILLSKENGASKLKNLMKSIMSITKSDNKEYLDLMFDFWAEGIKGHEKGVMLTEMNKFYKSYRKLFEDVLSEGIEDGSIRKDIDPFETSSIIIGTLDGVMVQWILDKKVIDLKKIEKNLINLILNGAGSQFNKQGGF
ncbi:MAG: TetR/AcrR family transcriptional regulator [Candidatus Aminicenantes bacterium]|nr:TetR/AcrR family transcriptional regulator [Candidatus Aminicenantes bacterium]